MSSQEDTQPSQDSTMTLIDEDRHEIIYFAYGSNLSTTQMLERCPFSTPIGLGYLSGWRWFINERGYANICEDQTKGKGKGKGKQTWRPLPPPSAEEAEMRHDDGGVWGMLYLLPPADEEKLDMHEGVPWAYQKRHIDLQLVQLGSGSAVDGKGKAATQEVKALVYVDGDRTTEGKVKEEYVDRMERGIREAVDEWGLDEGYADRVMRRFWR